MPTLAITDLFNNGVRCVRVQIDPTPFYLAANNSAIDALLVYAFLPVTRFTAAGIKCIVDMHDQFFPAVSTLYNASDILSDTTRFNHMKAVKAYVASKLAAAYAADVAAFEMFNEVAGGTSAWAGTQAPALFAAIRASAPDHTIVVGGQTWANASGLVELSVSDFDANTLFTVHDYEQQIVSHQSIYPEYFGPYPAVGYLTRVPFPPDSTKKAATVAAAKANVDADLWSRSLTGPQKTTLKAQVDSLLNDYFDTPYGKTWMRSQTFTPVLEWAQDEGIPVSRIFWGETGCWGDVDGKQGADPTTRVNYIRTKRELADEIGVKIFVHELLGTATTAWQIVTAPGETDLDPVFQAALGLSSAPSSPPMSAPSGISLLFYS